MLLLISWTAAGYIWYSNTLSQNQVGSMLKDADLETCSQIDINSQEFTQKIKLAVQELSQKKIDQINTDSRKIIQTVMLDKFDYEQRLCFTEGEVAQKTLETTLFVLEGFMENAARQAQNDSFKTSVSATVADVIQCIEQGGYVTEPAPNIRICRDDQSARFWPEFLQEGASWGGCDFMIDRKDQEFTYCATNKGIVSRCTAEGCTF